MWAATGTAIAHVPTIAELRHPVEGQNITFNAQGQSARLIAANSTMTLLPDLSDAPGRVPTATRIVGAKARSPKMDEVQISPNQTARGEKIPWPETVQNGLKASREFLSTPTGFLMAIYGVNIVAWGAMLFFLLLGASPAMNNPSKDSDESPRKKWIEIDSQILNALFCVTGFGLAPWRLRDLWWLIQARLHHNQAAMNKLSEQNKAWFRPPSWYNSDENIEGGFQSDQITFTGNVAPPTNLWKLSFVVWMMVLNTLFQGALAGFMWGYNRFDRPSWATGVFIGLGCGVSLLAGLMMWWEGRKVKKIEGPVVKVVGPVM